MSRTAYLLGWALLAVGGAFLLTDRLLTPSPGLTEENMRRVRPGMTLAQVERILHKSAPHRKRVQCLARRDDGPWELVCEGPPCVWTGRHGSLTVIFNWDDRVRRVTYERIRQRQPGPLDHLRAWLGFEGDDLPAP